MEQLHSVLETFLAFFFFIFNFRPKVRISQRLWPLIAGYFWQFSKCSHFSNISSFLEPFCIEQLQCAVDMFLTCFFAILNFDPK